MIDVMTAVVGACTIGGPLLGPSDFGVAPEQPVADTSAIVLPDGRVRMYMFAQGKGIVSAVSVTPDGDSFVPADGLTFEQETYDVSFDNDPDVLRLADGTLVMYYGQFDPQVGGTINLARCPDPGAGR